MTQHFLLSAEARTLSVRKVFGMSDEEAFGLFKGKPPANPSVN